MPTKILADHHKIQGVFTPPGDKSVSHRAVMFGALSNGICRFTNFLEAEDCLSTLSAFQQMGVSISLEEGKGNVTVEGVGLRGLKAPEGEIYLGNSGTSMRLLLGILAGQKLEATLAGDDSLSSRPMQRITQPLKKMGAQIKGRDQGNFAPLTIRGGKLKGIEYLNKLGSAQVKSAILFAGLHAEGKTRIKEFVASRDHTERFLSAAGVPLKEEDGWIELERVETLNAFDGKVPGDISSAAFFIVGAAMTEGSEITIEDVSLNPTRTGLLDVLQRMGAQIETEVTSTIPEPVGRIHVRGSRLKGTGIVREEIPSLIDELPILMTAMAVSEGESLISGAEELRVKETDRIRSMAANLSAVGANIEELPDGCVIRGVERLKGASVESFGDHRTVMSLAIATLVMDGEIEIDDISSVSTSFPTFFEAFFELRK